jgi:hypothetical protein
MSAAWFRTAHGATNQVQMLFLLGSASSQHDTEKAHQVVAAAGKDDDLAVGMNNVVGSVTSLFSSAAIRLASFIDFPS